MKACTLILSAALIMPASAYATSGPGQRHLDSSAELIMTAGEAKQHALAFRVEKYLPALQQSINDASTAGEMSVKVPLPNIPWRDLQNIREYLEAGGYRFTPYGERDSQALIVKW